MEARIGNPCVNIYIRGYGVGRITGILNSLSSNFYRAYILMSAMTLSYMAPERGSAARVGFPMLLRVDDARTVSRSPTLRLIIPLSL